MVANIGSRARLSERRTPESTAASTPGTTEIAAIRRYSAPAAATVSEAPVRASSGPDQMASGMLSTVVRVPASSGATLATRSSSSRRPPPCARATRMLTETPKADSVIRTMKTRLLPNPTAAMAVAPSAPTTTWLTKFITSSRTISRLTGTAMLAICRRGDRVSTGGMDCVGT